MSNTSLGKDLENIGYPHHMKRKCLLPSNNWIFQLQNHDMKVFFQDHFKCLTWFLQKTEFEVKSFVLLFSLGSSILGAGIKRKEGEAGEANIQFSM